MTATVAIVGAGRAGRALARRLRESGWTIGAVVTRSVPTARAAVRAIGAGRPHAKLTRLLLVADVVLVATPDDKVLDVATALARIGGEEWCGRIVLHTSGALDRSALAPLARLGAATGSLHPLQTFSRRTAPKLEGVVFAIEGDARARRMAAEMARALGGEPMVLESRSKAPYHAAGSFAAPHLLAVVETAAQILMALGFTRRRAVRALLPLIRQVLDNFERLGPRASWTGPISRGDYKTVAIHMKVLRKFPREFRQAYAALARLGVRLLAANPRATLRRLDRALKKS